MKLTRLVAVALVATAVLATGAWAQGEQGSIALTPLLGGNLPIQYLQQTDGGGMAKVGFAVGATGEYIINGKWSVGGRFVYDRLGMDLDDADASGHWAIFQFGGFAKYVILPEQPMRPFVRVGVLLGKAKATIDDGSGGSNSEQELDISMAPGFEAAVGAVHKVADNISLYGEAGWMVIATDGTDADNVVDGTTTATGQMEKHLQWIGIKAGATFYLGTK